MLRCASRGIASASDGRVHRPAAHGAAPCRPMPLEDGGALATIDDVSERARLDAVRTDFVANISHELKTPVGALAVLAEALADIDDPDRRSRARREDGRRGAPCCAHDRRSARAVADGARRCCGDGPGVDRPGDRRCSSSGPKPLPTTTASRSRSSSAPTTFTRVGSHRQLVSAVANLLENAVKYSDAGSEVVVESRCGTAGSRSSSRTHGVGIPPRDIDRIFERFYRVDRARSRDTGGTGSRPVDRASRGHQPLRRGHRAIA